MAGSKACCWRKAVATLLPSFALFSMLGFFPEPNAQAMAGGGEVGDGSDADSGPPSVIDETLPREFYAAWRDYIGLYSSGHFNDLSIRSPELAYALFGSGARPYAVQDFDPDRAWSHPDFEPLADPNADPGCAPVFLKAVRQLGTEPVLFRGTVVLFHGYTACPQQYYPWAKRLIRQGYHVLIPLLPGQGRGPAPTPSVVAGKRAMELAEYQGQYLPEGADGAERYVAFAAAVNHLAALLPGPKYIIGFSAGGAIAHRAVLQAPGFYRRALLNSTFYRPPGMYLGRRMPADPERPVGDALYSIERWLIRQLHHLPISWGAPCYASTQLGRRGICDFAARHLEALSRFGEATLHLAQQEAQAAISWTRTQYVTVEFDGSADTVAVRAAYQAQKAAHPEALSMCFYHGTPHSFFSLHDDPAIVHYWLESFFQQADRFLTAGQAFDVDGPSGEFEDGDKPEHYRLCHIPAADRL